MLALIALAVMVVAIFSGRQGAVKHEKYQGTQLAVEPSRVNDPLTRVVTVTNHEGHALWFVLIGSARRRQLLSSRRLVANGETWRVRVPIGRGTTSTSVRLYHDPPGATPYRQVSIPGAPDGTAGVSRTRDGS
jgi:hypothetical protein